MKLEVQPIVRELDLGGYAPVYAGKMVYVWVNAPAAFLRERDLLVVEYGRQLREVTRLRQAREADASNKFLIRLPFLGKRPAGEATPVEAVRTVDRFNRWVAQTFLPRIDAWFADLLSHGPEDTHWTAEELDTIYEQDSILLEWIKRRSLELVQDYAAEKKRPFEPPSNSS